MAVYTLPEEFENDVPRWDIARTRIENEQVEKHFLDRLASWAKARNAADENAGAVVRWQIADGYAQYLVAATEPVQLIHLPIGDGWDFPLAERATKEDIIGLINRDKAWAALVASKKAAK